MLTSVGPPHVGTKGIPPPGAPCSGDCWRETPLSPHQHEEAPRLSVCHRVSGSSPSSPGGVDFTSAPLVHWTHGLIQAARSFVWLSRQPQAAGCWCKVSISHS